MRRVLVLGVVLLAGCGGGGSKAKDTAPGNDGAEASATAEATATVDPNVIVRWPRFWATRDNAENGSDDNMDTRYFGGYDSRAVVYNGQDIIRTLTPDKGRLIGKTLLPAGRFVCAVPPRRQIDGGVAVFGIGSLSTRGGTCDQVIGVSTKTGKRRWSHGGIKTDDLQALRIDSRDGKVVVAAGLSLAVLDVKTGKTLWQRTAKRLTRSKGKDRSFPCLAAAALAADAPVLVVYPSDCADTFDREEILGLDLATGRRRWATPEPRDPDQFHAYFEQPHPLDGRVLGGIGDGNHRKRPQEDVFVDSKSGHVSQYAEPAILRYGAVGSDVEMCTDFGDSTGIVGYSPCTYVSGAHLLYAIPSVGRKRSGATLISTNLITGKKEWVFQRKETKNASGYEESIQFLGLNDDRTQFWIAEDKANVVKVDVATGKVVARGHLGPPLGLPRFAEIGPGFMLVRGSSGVEGVSSGLDYYKTEAR